MTKRKKLKYSYLLLKTMNKIKIRMNKICIIENVRREYTTFVGNSRYYRKRSDRVCLIKLSIKFPQKIRSVLI